VDIFEPVDKRVYIFPSEEDRQWAASVIDRAGDSPVLICRTAGPRTNKKNWPESYWARLIPELLKKFRVIEVGSASEENSIITLEGYTNLTGKTSLHQLAALMEKSKLLICPVTGLLHLSSASGIPTVCIAGGSEPASATSYQNTRHLVDRPACADCYEQGPCTQQFICLHAIHPETVLATIDEMLNHATPHSARD
jgi:ADP-heptose:LPS heptosyltransferase